MTFSLPRRRFLTAALGALGGYLKLGPSSVHAQTTGPRPTTLIVGRRIIDVNGKPAPVFGIHQPDGAPGLTLDPGQRFKLTLENQAGEPTIIHWHGQTPPPNQDGVVDTGVASLINPGSSQSYDFSPRVGTHWMHSHHGLQEQLLMAAPLIIRSEEDLQRDTQEVVVLLHDFTFRDPSEVLADLTGRTPNMQNGMSMPKSHAGDGPGTSMGGMHMGGMHMGDHAMPMPAGSAMDMNDVDYDAYLANDRTLSDPLVVRTERSARVRLRFINGATTTAFWIDLGTLHGAVTAVDGDPVRPVTGQRFPIAQGQRLDILVQSPRDGGAFPVLAQRDGDRQRTGIILASPGASIVKVGSLAQSPTRPVDLSLERRLASLSSLQVRQPSVTHRIILAGTMQPYVWSINGRTWSDHQRLRVSKGQRVVIEMVNQSMMAHPMHLHGHHFQVIALNGQSLRGAMRDTVLVPVHGSVIVAFDADNPGRWLLHCHNLFHMATGMMTEVAYDNT
jgi:FtsP/CotA-like multicopper oxidase with cupredoxin domain